MVSAVRSPQMPDSTPTPWFLTATTLAAVPWLARLRWARAAIDVIVVAASLGFEEFDFPLRRIAPLLVLSALVNTATAVRFGRSQTPGRLLSTVDFALQAVILTELLELTGGPFNPFVVVYAVPIMLAALTLGAASGTLVAAVSIGGYAMLAFWHLTESVPGHHRLNDVPTHLFTMWLSLAMTAELAAFFLVQASNALARREDQLKRMREQAARSERVVSLTTLAAGAAHELSTPLGTIAVAARELERAVAARPDGGDLAGDARLIRTEVERCRSILDQMSGRAGGVAVDRPELVSVRELVADVRSRLPEAAANRLTIDQPDQTPSLFLPRAGLVQAVVSLVSNALDATPEASGDAVLLRVTATNDAVSIAVVDRGEGMSGQVLARAGEPFFTTKDPGKGLGLGLFLARVFAERVGGTLTLQSDAGTSAVLQLPLDAVSPGADL